MWKLFLIPAALALIVVVSFTVAWLWLWLMRNSLQTNKQNLVSRRFAEIKDWQNTLLLYFGSHSEYVRWRQQYCFLESKMGAAIATTLESQMLVETLMIYEEGAEGDQSEQEQNVLRLLDDFAKKAADYKQVS